VDAALAAMSRMDTSPTPPSVPTFGALVANMSIHQLRRAIRNGEMTAAAIIESERRGQQRPEVLALGTPSASG
jgi:hypothetical protein